MVYVVAGNQDQFFHRLLWEIYVVFPRWDLSMGACEKMSAFGIETVIPDQLFYAAAVFWVLVLIFFLFARTR